MRQVAPAASIHCQEMNTGRGSFRPDPVGSRHIHATAHARCHHCRHGIHCRCEERRGDAVRQPQVSAHSTERRGCGSPGADCGSLARTSGSRGGRRGSAAAAVARAPSGGTRSTCAGKGRPQSNRGGGRAVGIGVLSSALDECGLFGNAAHGSAKGGRCVRAPVEDLLQRLGRGQV